MLRFLVRLKGPESYLHLSPLNQTLVSCLRQKGEGFKQPEQKVSVNISILITNPGNLFA